MKKILCISFGIFLSYGCAPPPDQTQQHPSQDAGGTNTVLLPPGPGGSPTPTVPGPGGQPGANQAQCRNDLDRSLDFFDTTMNCINRSQNNNAISGCLNAATAFLPNLGNFVSNPAKLSAMRRDMGAETRLCGTVTPAEFKGCLVQVFQQMKNSFSAEASC